MSDNILGLDINEDFISAVQVTSGLKGFQIISRATVMIDKDNNLDKALEELSQNMDMKSDTCMASISGGWVLYQNLIMPFKEPKKIKQTLPFEMETLVPFPIDDIVIDFNIVRSSEQSEVLAISARKSLISEYIERLKKLDVSPHLVDIRPVPIALWLLSQTESPDEGLLLDIGLNGIAMALFMERRMALVRYASLDSGIKSHPNVNSTSAGDAPKREETDSILQASIMMINNCLRSFSWQIGRKVEPEKIFLTGIGSMNTGIEDIISSSLGLPVARVNVSKDKRIHMDYSMETRWNPALMDGALSLAVREIRKGHGFNLRKGEFAIKKGIFKTGKELRRLGIFILIILLLLLIDLGIDYHLVKSEYQAARQRCAELYNRSFPDAKNVKEPVLEMKQKISELEKSASILSRDINREQKVLDIINDISKRIPAASDIDIKSMDISGETVHISGETDSFNTVNNIQSDLEPSTYFSDVKISGKLDKTGKRVEFDLKLQRK
ncbi:MAG TPA: pilus assembly protein PilM [Desulfatiglandales bacterium]|nr:pilus assembly protein PilM [Desulfatiglandales bacterium]